MTEPRPESPGGQTAHERQLHEALSEVMEWINNWSPQFIEDEEWPATDQKVTDALSGTP